VEIKALPLHQRNIDDVLRIQKTAYPENYLEDAHSFIAKIAASPGVSCAAWRGDVMVGYLIAVPLSTDDGVELNSSEVPAVPLGEARVMYIHDVAVHPDARGAGVADLLLRRLINCVQGTSVSEWRLVSVQGSQGFWENRGFVVSPEPPPIGYGPEAVLMLRR
jgi:GNAT superfamily N-acetyltransferase